MPYSSSYLLRSDEENHHLPVALGLKVSANAQEVAPSLIFAALPVAGSSAHIRDIGVYQSSNSQNNGSVPHALAHASSDTVSSNIKFVDLFSDANSAGGFELRVAPDGKGVVESNSRAASSQPLAHSPNDQSSHNITFTDLFSSAKATSGGGGSTSVSSTGSVVATYNAGNSNGTTGYDIKIDFQGTGWTQVLQDPFIKMANYLATNIIGDLPGTGTYNGKTFDDLYVTAKIGAIDGVGGILGQAGPSAVWSTNNLTAIGSMQFDSADATNYAKLGLWDDIVVHEFMHVEGFGSLWNYNRSLASTSGQYTGAQGLAAYKAAGHADATYVPVETGGGSGTAGSHWSEAQLTNELMTGYINNPNHMDTFSVMSLADLGYALKSSVDPLLI